MRSRIAKDAGHAPQASDTNRDCRVICFALFFGDSTLFGICTVKMLSLLSQGTASTFTFWGNEKRRSKIPYKLSMRWNFSLFS